MLQSILGGSSLDEMAALQRKEKEEEDEARQDYLDYYRLLLEQQLDVTRSFDKAMLTLSGGALGLSMVFIREVAPHPIEMDFIMGAWFFFGMSLLCIVLSFRSSKLMLLRKRQAEGEAYNRKSVTANWLVWDRITMWLNRFAMVYFFIGAALFAAFVVRNVS